MESNSSTENQEVVEETCIVKPLNTNFKPLKGLLKKSSCAVTKNEKKKVKFAETMMVYCDDWPEEVMPQIIALRPAADYNLVEIAAQGFMFEPPVEYQDLLPFDPPPDYRDCVQSSICSVNPLSTYEKDSNINFIDNENNDIKSSLKCNSQITSSLRWENMILNEGELLEEDIIGVLKEDEILQAIGSQAADIDTVFHSSNQDDLLGAEDFPIHYHSQEASKMNDIMKENELGGDHCSITSETSETLSENDDLSSDIASDSSLTSQDTIILTNSIICDNNLEKDKKVCDYIDPSNVLDYQQIDVNLDFEPEMSKPILEVIDDEEENDADKRSRKIIDEIDAKEYVKKVDSEKDFQLNLSLENTDHIQQVNIASPNLLYDKESKDSGVETSEENIKIEKSSDELSKDIETVINRQNDAKESEPEKSDSSKDNNSLSVSAIRKAFEKRDQQTTTENFVESKNKTRNSMHSVPRPKSFPASKSFLLEEESQSSEEKKDIVDKLKWLGLSDEPKLKSLSPSSVVDTTKALDTKNWSKENIIIEYTSEPRGAKQVARNDGYINANLGYNKTVNSQPNANFNSLPNIKGNIINPKITAILSTQQLNNQTLVHPFATTNFNIIATNTITTVTVTVTATATATSATSTNLTNSINSTNSTDSTTSTSNFNSTSISTSPISTYTTSTCFTPVSTCTDTSYSSININTTKNTTATITLPSLIFTTPTASTEITTTSNNISTTPTTSTTTTTTSTSTTTTSTSTSTTSTSTSTSTSTTSTSTSTSTNTSTTTTTSFTIITFTTTTVSSSATISSNPATLHPNINLRPHIHPQNSFAHPCATITSTSLFSPCFSLPRNIYVVSESRLPHCSNVFPGDQHLRLIESRFSPSCSEIFHGTGETKIVPQNCSCHPAHGIHLVQNCIPNMASNFDIPVGYRPRHHHHIYNVRGRSSSQVPVFCPPRHVLYIPRLSPTQSQPNLVAHSHVYSQAQNQTCATQAEKPVQVPIISQSANPHPSPFHPRVYAQRLDQEISTSKDTQFPDPSEIRRRDGLNAYPHVWEETPKPATLPVPPNSSKTNETKDELVQFVEQGIPRIERIITRRHSSINEGDDPTFGFARRPSVRGIKPKYGSTNEIINQMQQQIHPPSNRLSLPNQNQSKLSPTKQVILVPKSQFQNVNAQQRHVYLLPQQSGYQRLLQAGATLPRPHQMKLNQDQNTSDVKCEINRPSSSLGQTGSIRNEQVTKLCVQDAKVHAPEYTATCLLQQKTISMPNVSMIKSSPQILTIIPMKDERGTPEGANSSPTHSSDIYTKSNAEDGENRNDNNNPDLVKDATSSSFKVKGLSVSPKGTTKMVQKAGVIYYSMNV